MEWTEVGWETLVFSISEFWIDQCWFDWNNSAGTLPVLHLATFPSNFTDEFTLIAEPILLFSFVPFQISRGLWFSGGAVFFKIWNTKTVDLHTICKQFVPILEFTSSIDGKIWFKFVLIYLRWNRMESWSSSSTNCWRIWVSKNGIMRRVFFRIHNFRIMLIYWFAIVAPSNINDR